MQVTSVFLLGVFILYINRSLVCLANWRTGFNEINDMQLYTDNIMRRKEVRFVAKPNVDEAQRIGTGNRIRECREKVNMKQRELAELLGISDKAVSLFETGTTMCSIPHLCEIADIFNVSLDYLLRGKEKNIDSDDKVAQRVASMSDEQKIQLCAFLDLYYPVGA